MQTTPAETKDNTSKAKKANANKLKKMAKNWQIIAGSVIIATFVIIAVFAPVIAPMNPLEIAVQNRLQSPSPAHPLGTDELGRDVLSRIIWGTRISLTTGVAATLFGSIVGTIFGIVSGYYGGKIDNIIMRFMDVLLAFPGILLALGIVTVLGSSTTNTIIAVSIFAVPAFARIVRGSVLGIKKLEYVDAIRTIGASDFRIITRHIFPNVLSPIIVQATLYVASAIVIAASLSFLGMGTQPPTPEWGTMLANGREFLRQAPHLITFPGIMILIVVLGFNLIGDGLRDVYAPKGR